jgi:hypothetical protein
MGKLNKYQTKEDLYIDIIIKGTTVGVKRSNDTTQQRNVIYNGHIGIVIYFCRYDIYYKSGIYSPLRRFEMYCVKELGVAPNCASIRELWFRYLDFYMENYGDLIPDIKKDSIKEWKEMSLNPF